MIGKKPVAFTAVQEDLGTSIAYALWSKVRDCIAYADASRPVGSLMFFYSTQQSTLTNSAGQNVDPPDAGIWQFCDGSVVSNTASPLFGVTLPDTRNRFFRQINVGETTGTIVGSDSIDLTHNHGGQTGVTNDQGGFDADIGNNPPFRARPFPHQHPISSDLGVISLVPVYRELQVFIRII